MKLHLPLALRAALLAVLCATQVWAERTLTIDGRIQNNWDGIIDENLLGNEIGITLSGSTFNTVELQDGGYIAYNRSTKATITVNGGEFTQSGGTIAVETFSEATITVEGGAFTQSGGEIGFLGSVTIDVKKDGKFSKSGGTIGDSTITVEAGGKFTQSEGDIAYSSGSSATIIVGGEFTQSGGYIAHYRDSKATITVDRDGEFTSTGGYLGEYGSVTIDVKGEGIFSKSGGYISNGTITVEDGGTFTLSGNATISSGETITVNGRFVQEGGTIDSGTSAVITIGEGGVYIMSGGTNNVATTTVETGGNYNYSGGTIGPSSFTVKDGGYFNLAREVEYTHSTALQGGGHITVNDSATYDLANEKGTLDIIMRGGSLTNAGSYEKNVNIDTGADYIGEVSLGGLDAARIKSVKIAGADTCITGMASGSTLTFSGENSIACGEASRGTEKAILQFEEGNGALEFAQGSSLYIKFNWKDLKQDVEYWLTNASDVTGWENAIQSLGLEISLKQGGENGWKLTASGMDKLWIASSNGTSVNEASHLDSYTSGVIVDQAMTLTLSTPGTTKAYYLTDDDTGSGF